MKVPVCGTCGYRSIDGVAPDKCPICMSPKDQFSEPDNAIMDPEGQDETLVKKHTPQITINKECGLVGEGCKDVAIRVGEILHPREEDHMIMYIDVFLDKQLIARYGHMGMSVNPATTIHLKPEASGKLQVVELCNKHGAWIAEADI